MKKIIYLIVLMTVFFVITGCGKDSIKKIECTFFTEGNYMNEYGYLSYYFKNDKITSEEIKVSFKDISTEISDDLWDYLVIGFNDQNSKVDEIGYKKYSSVDNKKHELYVTEEIDFKKISKESIKKYDIDDLRGKSFEKIKKDFMEANPDSKLTCK